MVEVISRQRGSEERWYVGLSASTGWRRGPGQIVLPCCWQLPCCSQHAKALHTAVQDRSPQVTRDAGRLLRHPNHLAQHVDVQGNGGLHPRALHLHQGRVGSRRGRRSGWQLGARGGVRPSSRQTTLHCSSCSSCPSCSAALLMRCCQPARPHPHLDRHIGAVAGQRCAIHLRQVGNGWGSSWGSSVGWQPFTICISCSGSSLLLHHRLHTFCRSSSSNPPQSAHPTNPTCPKEAEAMGWGVMRENSVVTGAPSSLSMMP